MSTMTEEITALVHAVQSKARNDIVDKVKRLALLLSAAALAGALLGSLLAAAVLAVLR